jgi:hypothetical protein
MRPAGIVVGIVVLILWFLGATLIAAPSNVVNMIMPPSLHLSSNVVQFIAISTFIAAAIIIALYTSMSKDESKTMSQELRILAPPNGLEFFKRPLQLADANFICTLHRSY